MATIPEQDIETGEEMKVWLSTGQTDLCTVRPSNNGHAIYE